MPYLKVKKEDGSLLFDTEKITYGLLKSGYLTATEPWYRKKLRSAQLNPGHGSSWVDNPNQPDPQWAFTVENSVSPILFIVGDGCLNGTSVSGATRTYIFGNASAGTKVYAFDIMRDIGYPPRLRTWLDSGQLTFNSFMPPLNIAFTVQPPGLGNSSGGAAVKTAYAGGHNQTMQGGYTPIQYSHYTIPLGNEEFASHLTFSRTGAVVPDSGTSGCSVLEGAGGYAGGVKFMFGPAGGSTVTLTGGQYYGYYGIPVDRMPTALVIRTANLPFPFG
jgi:hypothetical protein